ncbi:MAG TPA: DNA repair protein RadC, partial [Bacteroidia bacterium]|nr:DNA repair protein RadC [Bacteroidia bacterium]
IGDAKALNIIAALELGRRRGFSVKEQLPQVQVSKDAWQVIRKDLDGLEHEEFWILMLNRSNRVTRKEKISQGGMNATIVDPRILFKSVIASGASSIILCHNHPSGAVKPSENDIRLTRKLKEGALLLDITLLDHIIAGADTYFSFADEGLL